MADIWMGLTCGLGAVVLIGVAALLAGWLFTQLADALIYAGECAVRQYKRRRRRTYEKADTGRI